MPRHVADRRPSFDVPDGRGGRVLGAVATDGASEIRHARVLHPGFSQTAKVPGASRANTQEVPTQAEEAFRQKLH